MNSRERVLAAVAHEEPDRTPRDFWAEPPTLNHLLAYLGHSEEELVLRHLEVDIRHLDAISPPEQEVGEGIYQNFWGERYTYLQTEWGPYRQDVLGALADVNSLAEIEAFPWPSPDWLDYSLLAEQSRRHEQYAQLYGFADVWQRPALVRGWEKMFLDMVDHPDWVHYICSKFTDFYQEDYTRAAEITEGRIDLYFLISDLGSQNGPLISLDMFREFVAPYFQKMIHLIHNLDAQVMVHSCGDVSMYIPDLIELGVDILDPIQPTGPEMSPERLKADFGDQLTFRGGIDMQQLLPHGSPEQVRREAQRYCEILGDGGGYILSSANLFQPDVPPENIVAMYQTS